jgi:hypothetical protein
LSRNTRKTFYGRISLVAFVSSTAGLASGYINGLGTNAAFVNPLAVAVDSAGTQYVADGSGHTIRKISSSGKSVSFGLMFCELIIRFLSGSVTLLAGMNGQSGAVDGPLISAIFNLPRAVAVDTSLNVYVADANGYRKVSSSGTFAIVVFKGERLLRTVA